MTARRFPDGRGHMASITPRNTVPGGVDSEWPERNRVKPCGLTKKSTAVPGTSGPAGADRVKFWYLIIFASGVDDMTSPLNVFRKPSNLATSAEEGARKTSSVVPAGA